MENSIIDFLRSSPFFRFEEEIVAEMEPILSDGNLIL